MLERLYCIKNYVDKVTRYNKDFKISWDNIEVALEALKPVAKATKKFQGQSINCSDFYKIWNDTIMNLEKLVDSMYILN